MERFMSGRDGRKKTEENVGIAKSVASALLTWRKQRGRELPWRAPLGQRPDPYHVWLSEIMLQQTTVRAVGPYFEKFLRRWPRVQDLAAAQLEEILQAWAGLGYYSRARNLHVCAQRIVNAHGGQLPDTEEELLALPGVGAYTAAAIAAIAFGRPATVVDGNVERVVARLFAATAPLPAVKPELRRLAATLTPRREAGYFAEAMMDLGATICTPRNPSCLLCPIAQVCAARAQGIAPQLPARSPKGEKPTRRGAIFVAVREDAAVLLRRRPEKGLLARMSEAPSGEWTEKAQTPAQALAMAPLKAEWRAVPGLVEHVFTHFHLELQVYRADVRLTAKLRASACPERCRWTPLSGLSREALPSVMRKVFAHAGLSQALAPVE
jgi:A/G-specific adenine glycosylase